jgi:uncharacterized protein (DUF4213/DUF364 family)
MQGVTKDYISSLLLFFFTFLNILTSYDYIPRTLGISNIAAVSTTYLI